MDTTEPPRSRELELADAARELLAGGDWLPLAKLTRQLADAVPVEKSLATYERLARAGGKPTSDKGEQERIGRERAIQEVFQHLVGRGKAEACGRGDCRQYRKRESTMSLLKRPKPRREWVPLDRLVFDQRLQFRIFPDGKLYDEAMVEAYRESRANGSEFPPLEVVEEKAGKKETLWAFAGFHRSEMYRRDGMASVECLIYPGTFMDARLYALRENGQHGRPRTAEECRRAFDTLIDSADMLAHVMQSVKESGGVQRSLAAACGISASVVGRYLEARGLQADRKTGKLVPIPKPVIVQSLPTSVEPTLSPQPKSEPTQPATMPAATQTTTPTAAEIESSSVLDALAKITSDLRSVARSVETLMKSKHLPRLRVLAKAKGIPFVVEDREEDDGVSGATKFSKVEVWPVIRDLGQLFADLSAQVHAG